MRLLAALLVCLLGPLAQAQGRTQVLVELFTSEGCSSCPPADAALATVAREQPIAGVEIVPLELHVDYWNSDGWVDPFSLPEATARQERYAAQKGGSGYQSQVYTPQMVVDGTRSFVGEKGLLLQAVTQAAASPPNRPLHAELRPAPGGVDVLLSVGPGWGTAVGLWVAVTEAGLSSQVTKGENQGRTLSHAPVVRSLEQVAQVPTEGWKGTVRLNLARAWRQQALQVVAFAQEPKTLRVVAVTSVTVPASSEAGASSAGPH